MMTNEELEKRMIELETQVGRLAIVITGMAKALSNQTKVANRLFNPVQNTK